MKKAEFKISFAEVDPKTGQLSQVVSGWVQGEWGVHKAQREYVVTHIPTGYLLIGFWWLAPAKDFARRMDQAVFPVNFASADLTKNKLKVREIYTAVYRDYAAEHPGKCPSYQHKQWYLPN